MKFLFFSLLCSVSLSHAMVRSTSPHLLPLETVEKELESLKSGRANIKVTIAAIKRGAPGLPTLEDAEAAKHRINGQLLHIQKILTWVSKKNPTPEKFNRVFNAYKKNRYSSLHQIAEEATPEPENLPSELREKRIKGRTFSEYLVHLDKKALRRSLSAPTTKEEEMTAQGTLPESPEPHSALATLFREEA
jgi:hypothetical protein